MNVLARQSIADLLGQSVEDIARIARGEEMSAAGAAVGAQTVQGNVTASSAAHTIVVTVISKTSNHP